MLKIYLSASISNAENNSYLVEAFPQDRFEVYLPQLITPDELSHVQFPLHVYQQCVDMMERSDVGLVILDAFGRDCAWECGWYAARSDKRLVGFVESSSLFMRDWMVKGGLDALITTNPRMFEAFQHNPLLSQKPLRLIESIEGLPTCLAELANVISDGESRP